MIRFHARAVEREEKEGHGHAASWLCVHACDPIQRMYRARAGAVTYHDTSDVIDPIGSESN
jgi:hypothetical protein